MGGTHRKLVENDTNLETYSLIWLDSLLTNNDDLVKARTSIHYSKTFDQLDQCEEYIRSLNSNDRAILIVDDSRARQLIPRIEQLRQISSIYIHTSNKNTIEQWAEQFLKIKIVTDQFDILINRIESSHKIDDLLSIVISTNKTQFLFSKFLGNCLFEMPSNTKIEFLTLCKLYYKDNPYELNSIQDFEQNYSSNQALSWYQRKSFIYRILIKAFRTQNIDILFMLRFFLRDLFEQIKQRQCSYPVRVYRSHLMTNDELQLFQNAIGQFISINSFLSASFDRGLALFHLYKSSDLERVLFEIDGEPPMLANVLSSEQILFTFGSIFRIENLSLDDEGIWIIRLKLSSNFIQYPTNVFTFGQLLIEQNDFTQAEKYFLRLLNEYPCKENDRIYCYEALGRIKKWQRNYDQSIEWFNKALQSENSIEIYNNLGEIYRLKNDFKQAIEFYNKSLILFVEQFGDKYHPKLVHCLNNIAVVYKYEKNYSQALDYHLKALAILDKSPTRTQSDLVIAYNNIGVIYRHLKQYDSALKYFELALKTYVNSSDSGLAKTYRNLGCVYEDKRDYKQALIYFRKSAACYRNVLSSVHPTILAIEDKIQSISSRLK